MSLRKGDLSVELKFEEAKRLYPFVMQSLVLFAKQEETRMMMQKCQKPIMPKMGHEELRGLCSLGVLRLEVSVTGKGALWLPPDVVELLKTERQQQIVEDCQQGKEKSK